jgi:hypothetical protein
LGKKSTFQSVYDNQFWRENQSAICQSVWKGAKVNEAFPLPEKNGGQTAKRSCKPVEQEETHEKGPRGSWARNHMGNAS